MQFYHAVHDPPLLHNLASRKRLVHLNFRTTSKQNNTNGLKLLIYNRKFCNVFKISLKFKSLKEISVVS